MKLGSLFDGSGGFPLAGMMSGVEPAWASEIEPYPIRVTTARFPDMKHLGDVTKIDGGAVEPVDIITFGSPCQDLSVAGKQAGLHKGERSNLFFEAIRIIKEMRRSTNGIYPRIAIWENVPGAFSSNKGEDFQAVLQAFCEVKDPAAHVPMPPKNKWGKSGAIVGDGWSVAWRTLDAQFWGVPQRRKRIYLVADFGSERAGEILFEQKSLRGDSAESGKAGEDTADNAEGSVGRGCAYGLTTKGNGDAFIAEERHMALSCGGGQAGQGYPAIIYSATQQSGTAGEGTAGDAERSVGRGVLFEPMSALEENWAESSVKNALRAGASKSSHAVCYAVRTGQTGANGVGVAPDAHTLDCANAQAVAYSVDCRNYRTTKEHGTLQAKENGGQSLNYMGAVCYPIDSHQQDSRFKICEDGVIPTLRATMGTGGNNGPMVLEAYSAGNGQLHQALEPELARPLDCMHDQKIVLHPSKPPRRYIIRRLTPLECCRIQGFPDWWENGVQGSDSARYKMWGNGLALPNAAHVVGCAVKLIKETQT